jgi:hypothetical protein
MAQKKPAELSTGASMVLGGVSGSLSELVIMPALVIRTRMQVQGADPSSKSYNGFVHALRTIVREEGVSAFYKGAAFNVALTPVARGMYMGALEASKKTLGEGTPLLDFASGMAAQLVASLAYVPRDVVLERCAVDGQLKSQRGSATGTMDALRTIVSLEGLSGFYRAYVPHQIVWVPFNGIFFTALGRVKAAEEAAGVDPSRYAVAVGNTFVAAAVAAALTNPIDVIKTRLQVAGANPEVFGEIGAVECVARLLRTEGPRALFAGLVGRFMYAGPGFAIWLPTYDLLKRLWLGRQDRDE